MNQGTCLLCFSVTRVLDIKYTHLQNVYEELSDSEIQADLHPLCFICCAKLHQCKRLLRQIQENNSVSQPEVRPLVHLGTFNNDNNWSLSNNYVEIELQPKVKQEYIKEEYVETSPDYYEDETAVEPVEDKHTPTEPRTTEEPQSYYVCSKKFFYSSYLQHLTFNDMPVTFVVSTEGNGVGNQRQLNEEAESELNQKKMLEILELQYQQEIKKLEKNKILMDLEIELKKVQLKNARIDLELKKSKLLH